MFVDGRSIRVLLIANRGEVVSRVARTAKKLGIRTVGVYAESDAHSAYINDVDVAVYLGDDTSTSPYLDADAILAAARACEADAIHPGYGFLSENAEFAEACEANGLIWVGPTPESMRAMGGKLQAKRIAHDAGVPVLESVRIGDDLSVVRELAGRVGLPLLIKPSAGGGGKGMHRIDDLTTLDSEVASARREALSSFGDDTLFVEQCVEEPRHVEVQVFGDMHGNVIHVGDRDCSIQRRHQKIVEEAPAPDLPDELREQLRSSAVALAKSIGYVGAGTVEYLYFRDRIAFLEMNTRLQVEHPVTEEVSGLDLVELQLRVAAGERLPISQEDVQLNGHAIEVRLYAEDPSNGYLPSPGLVRAFDHPALPLGRWEVGVKAGSRVSSRYDPMIAKIIATGTHRSEAAARLAAMLDGLRVHGVTTNKKLLRNILVDDAFLDAQLSTAYLDGRPELATDHLGVRLDAFHATALTVHTAMVTNDHRQLQQFAPYGWRNMRTQDETLTLHEDQRSFEVSYRQERDESWTVSIDADTHRARVFGRSNDGIDIEVDGHRRQATVSSYADEAVVDTRGATSRYLVKASLQEEADVAASGACVATVPGTVVEVLAEVDQKVESGDVLVVIEAMKMEHRLTASGSGVVERVLVSTGESVDYQQLLVDVRLEAVLGEPS
jgi:3-methylcrotonyl-CoA carboxylase alpha subunit